MWEGVVEQGRAAMSCFFHMVAPQRKEQAPDVSPQPQAPGPELAAPTLEWGCIASGAGRQPPPWWCPHTPGHGTCRDGTSIPFSIPQQRTSQV